MEIFRDNDKAYFSWFRKTEDGYVLNTRKRIDVEYMTLHTANCSHIATTAKNYAPNAFTGRDFIKVCSNDPKEIIAWIISKGGNGITHYCKSCKPSNEGLESTTAQTHTTNTKNKKIIGNKYPKARLSESLVYERDRQVGVAVLARAKGFCECCKKRSPFIKKSTGKLYLEVHHKIFLSEGGEDTVENAEALCPNCHREKHFG